MKLAHNPVASEKQNRLVFSFVLKSEHCEINMLDNVWIHSCDQSYPGDVGDQ